MRGPPKVGSGAGSGALMARTTDGFRPNRHLRTPFRPLAPAAAPAGRRKVGIYLRTSDPKQKQTSLEDQERECRAAAERMNRDVVSVHSDRWKSGFTLAGRHGLSNLLAEAELGLFDDIMVHRLDRLSRSQPDVQSLRKRLATRGIGILEATGEVHLASLALGALRAEEERDSLVARSAEGRRIMVEQGLVPHDCSYGYVLDPHAPGRHLPDHARAGVIRTIFEHAAAGVPDREIAAGINAPTPRDCQAIDRGRRPTGAKWTAAMVARIRQKPIYRGVLIDGRTKLVRDPDTEEVLGYADVPEAAWRCVSVPRLRIVGDDVWKAAQDGSRSGFNSLSRNGPTRQLLSGFAMCAACGGKLVPRRVAIGRPRTEWTCPAPATCGGCGYPPVAGLDRATLGVVDRFLEEVMDMRPPLGGPQNTLLDDDVRRRLLTERDGLERQLEAEIVDPAASHRRTAARRAADEQRLRVIDQVLHPRADDGTTIDPRGTRDAIAAAIALDPDVAVGNACKLVFEGVRRLCFRVDVHSRSTGGWRIVVGLDPSGVGLSGERATPRSFETAVDPRTRSAALVNAEADKEIINDLADRPETRLPGSIALALDTLSPPLSDALAAIGWSVAGVIEAATFKRSTGAVSGAFGNAPAFDAARRLIRDGGVRGAMKRTLDGSQARFGQGLDSLFYRQSQFCRLAPEIEAAMDANVIAAIRRATLGLPKERRERLLRVAEWLDRSRALGIAASFASGDCDLTMELAHLLKVGFERFLVDPPPSALALAQSLSEGEGFLSDGERLRMRLVLAHLRMPGSSVAPSSWENLYNAVRRFRAAGLEGILTRNLRQPRLSAEQHDELVRLVGEGVDPRNPTRPISSIVLSELAAERFGVFLIPEAVMNALGRRETTMRHAEANLPRRRRRILADIVGTMVFEGDD